MDVHNRLEKPDVFCPSKRLVINDCGIRLGQALKLAGIAENGTEAKRLLAAGAVAVNGRQEKRRGRQLIDGDIIGFTFAGADKGCEIIIAAE